MYKWRSDCMMVLQEYSAPGGMGVVRSKSTLEDAANHAQGAVIQFQNAANCMVFSFRAVIQRKWRTCVTDALSASWIIRYDWEKYLSYTQ